MQITEEMIKDIIKKGKLKYIKMLNNLGYDFTYHNYYFLTIAAEYGQYKIIKYLCKKGNCNDVYNLEWVLINAVRNNHLNIVKFLIDNYHLNYKNYQVNLSKVAPYNISNYLKELEKN